MQLLPLFIDLFLVKTNGNRTTKKKKSKKDNGKQKQTGKHINSSA
jgi:hypothetical protein